MIAMTHAQFIKAKRDIAGTRSQLLVGKINPFATLLVIEGVFAIMLLDRVMEKLHQRCWFPRERLHFWDYGNGHCFTPFKKISTTGSAISARSFSLRLKIQ